MPNHEEIKRFLFDYGYGEANERFHGGHLDLLNYPRLMWSAWNGLGPAIILAAAVIIALAIYFRRKGRPVESGRIDIWLFVAWVAVAYVCLNTTRDQRMRFLLPLLPGACVLLGCLAASIRTGVGRKIAAGAIGLACVGGLVYATLIPQATAEGIEITGERDWQMAQIAEFIANDHEGDATNIRVAFLAHHPLFNAKAFDLEALLHGHDFRVQYPESLEYVPAR